MHAIILSRKILIALKRIKRDSIVDREHLSRQMESIKNSNLRRSTNMHMDQGVSPRNQESSKAPAMVFTFFEQSHGNHLGSYSMERKNWPSCPHAYRSSTYSTFLEGIMDISKRLWFIQNSGWLLSICSHLEAKDLMWWWKTQTHAAVW